jgi:hypothetical protein
MRFELTTSGVQPRRADRYTTVTKTEKVPERAVAAVSVTNHALGYFLGAQVLGLKPYNPICPLAKFMITECQISCQGSGATRR